MGPGELLPRQFACFEELCERILEVVFNTFDLTDQAQVQAARGILLDSLQPVIKSALLECIHVGRVHSGGRRDSDVQTDHSSPSPSDSLTEQLDELRNESSALKITNNDLNDKIVQIQRRTQVKINQLQEEIVEKDASIKKLNEDLVLAKKKQGDDWKAKNEELKNLKEDLKKLKSGAGKKKGKSSDTDESPAKDASGVELDQLKHLVAQKEAQISDLVSKLEALTARGEFDPSILDIKKNLAGATERAKSAEVCLLRLQKDTEVRTLRRALKDADANIANVNQIVESQRERGAFDAAMEWNRYCKSWEEVKCHLVLSIQDAESDFERHITLVSHGMKRLIDLKPVQVRPPPEPPSPPQDKSRESVLMQNIVNSTPPSGRGSPMNSLSGLSNPRDQLLHNSFSGLGSGSTGPGGDLSNKFGSFSLNNSSSNTSINSQHQLVNNSTAGTALLATLMKGGVSGVGGLGMTSSSQVGLDSSCSPVDPGSFVGVSQNMASRHGNSSSFVGNTSDSRNAGGGSNSQTGGIGGSSSAAAGMDLNLGLRPPSADPNYHSNLQSPTNSGHSSVSGYPASLNGPPPGVPPGFHGQFMSSNNSTKTSSSLLDNVSGFRHLNGLSANSTSSNSVNNITGGCNQSLNSRAPHNNMLGGVGGQHVNFINGRIENGGIGTIGDSLASNRNRQNLLGATPASAQTAAGVLTGRPSGNSTIGDHQLSQMLPPYLSSTISAFQEPVVTSVGDAAGGPTGGALNGPGGGGNKPFMASNPGSFSTGTGLVGGRHLPPSTLRPPPGIGAPGSVTGSSGGDMTSTQMADAVRQAMVYRKAAVLFETLKSRFPAESEQSIRNAVDQVRKTHVGMMTGMTVDDVVEASSKVLMTRKKSAQAQQPQSFLSSLDSFTPPSPDSNSESPNLAATNAAGSSRNFHNQPSANGNRSGAAMAESSNPSQAKHFNDSCSQCPICYQDFSGVGRDADPPRTRISCGHIFCDKCLRKWLESNKTCPICRNYSLHPDDYPSLS